jgi:hypothetical protein
VKTWAQASHWSDDRVTELKAHFAAGHTASEIARMLNGNHGHGLFSRNAVIGKLHRMGMKWDRPQPPKATTPKKRSRADCGAMGNIARNINRLKAAKPLAAPPIVDASFARPWLQREDGQCGYPLLGAGADTWSCCAPTQPGSNYCPAHHAACRTPLSLEQKHLARTFRRFLAA